MRIPVGSRVRFNDKCVWGVRCGLEGVTVNVPVPGQYPDHRGLWDGTEVLVLLDDDPLTRLSRTDQIRRGWTCVTATDTVDVLP